MVWAVALDDSRDPQTNCHSHCLSIIDQMNDLLLEIPEVALPNNVTGSEYG